DEPFRASGPHEDALRHFDPVEGIAADADPAFGRRRLGIGERGAAAAEPEFEIPSPGVPEAALAGREFRAQALAQALPQAGFPEIVLELGIERSIPRALLAGRRE